MFVHPARRWAQGAVYSAIGAFGLVACSDPDLNTDLRPEGPPDVLTVLVHAEGSSQGDFAETVTYCKTGDAKRPDIVGLPDFSSTQICPFDLAMGVAAADDGSPSDFFVRFQFDELLNPDIETLTEVPDADGVFTGSILPADPVASFTCGGVDVPFDGWYDPSGNSFTWPLGPSLVVRPTDYTAIPAGSECSISLNAANVVDKEGNPTPDSQAFTFSLAPLEFLDSDPAPEEDPADAAVIAPDSVVTLLFSGNADPASLAANEVVLRTVNNCTDQTTIATKTASIGGDPGAIEISDAGAPAGQEFEAETFYVLEFAAGAEVEDLGGATAELPAPADYSLCFETDTAS